MQNDTIVDTKENNFKRGLDFQREIFKNAKAEYNVYLMCSCIENLKSEIKTKAVHRGMEKDIEYIEDRIKWFKGLRSRFTVRTKSGYKYCPKKNWKTVAINHLQDCYEKIILILTNLELL